MKAALATSILALSFAVMNVAAISVQKDLPTNYGPGVNGVTRKPLSSNESIGLRMSNKNVNEAEPGEIEIEKSLAELFYTMNYLHYVEGTLDSRKLESYGSTFDNLIQKAMMSESLYKSLKSELYKVAKFFDELEKEFADDNGTALEKLEALSSQSIERSKRKYFYALLEEVLEGNLERGEFDVLQTVSNTIINQMKVAD